LKQSTKEVEISTMLQQNKVIMKQNEIIISLLGRLAFTQKQIREIIEKNKNESLKQKYIDGYNALDGSKTVSEIAAIVGVKQGTFSPILAQWSEKGIIYEVEQTGGGKFYEHLFLILGDSSDK
jgi:DNA-binding MarR family transcriptional regulator